MKVKLSIIVIGFVLCTNISGQSTGNCAVDNILSGYSERAYTNVPVTDQQLDLILKCGIKAPSARNNQPWRFTLINDETSMKEIVADILPGNVLIVISGVEPQNGTTSDFDCGLAAESMFTGAHGLGLGSRIYGSPVGNINSNREAFQIPAGYKAVIVLRVGNVDKGVDAISAATSRKQSSEIVNFKK
jgi:nitroreductase